MIFVDRPTCAKCGCRVPEFRSWHDPLTRDHVYEVRCHGAREQTRLSFDSLTALREPPLLLAGIAFAEPGPAPTLPSP